MAAPASGGMAQRAALARALLNEPLLLTSRWASWIPLPASMQRGADRPVAAEGYTSLLVTHDIEEALLLCDRVIMSPRPGRIIAEFELPLTYPAIATIRCCCSIGDILRILGQGEDWCAGVIRGVLILTVRRGFPGGRGGRAAPTRLIVLARIGAARRDPGQG